MGFAAESNDVISNAMGRSEENLDFIVANDIGAPGAGSLLTPTRCTFSGGRFFGLLRRPEGRGG